MDLGLKDKRALVMGSTRGIGQAIAAGLAAEGAAVAVCGRKLDDAEASAESINAAAKAEGAGTARAYALDLSDNASVTALIDSVGRDFGGVDIVLCNGGGPPPGPVAEVTPDSWAAQFNTMFVNQTRVVNAFLPGMRESGWGRILVVSSSGVVQPIINLGMSNALRASLIGWSKTLSNEVAADGVTVNAILPGRIHTSRVDELDASASKRLGKPVDQIARDSKALIPMGRYGTVEEFADVAVFMLSARAGYMTGGVVRVDGGMIKGV